MEPSCFDGIQNCHDGSCEEDIDCGGPCDSCEIRKFAEIPGLMEIKFIIKYPWLLWIIVAIVMSLTVSWDRAYIKKISKMKFKEYRKRMIKYSKIRYKIYIVAITLSSIILIYSFYIFSLQFKKDYSILYIGTLLTIIVAAILIVLVHRIVRYDEKEKKKEEKRFLESDKRKIEDLIRLEEETLLKLELGLGIKLYRIITSPESDKDNNDIIDSFKQVYMVLRDLSKRRKINLMSLETDDETRKIVGKLSSDKTLERYSKNYSELKEILKSVRRLRNILANRRVQEEKRINAIKDYMFDMVELSVNKYIMVIIQSDKKLVSVYNKLVDIYDLYKNQFDNKKNAGEEIIKIEVEFRKKLEEMTHSVSNIEAIKGNPNLKSYYNTMVDLYNNYKKKEDLLNDLRQIELRKRELMSF